jgi:hypothetical protein
MDRVKDLFLPSDIEIAKQERRCGIYLLERIALEFKHGNYNLMQDAAEELVRTAKHLEELRQRKLDHDRFVKPTFVKVYPLNPITIQEYLRGAQNE